MSMSSAVVWWPVVLCGVLTVSGGLARLTEEEVPPVPAQDTLGILGPLQQASEGSSNELRKMANMYELLQLAALQQQQQRQRLLELEEREEGEELPLAYPSTKIEKEDYFKDKRGSYMSLCHFKICNMGRKRNSYWNTWGRN